MAYGYGLYSYGLYSYGLYSYGLCSHGSPNQVQGVGSSVVVQGQIRRAAHVLSAIDELSSQSSQQADGPSFESKVKRAMDDMLERMPQPLATLDEKDVASIKDELTLFFLSESQLMNGLLQDLQRDISELGAMLSDLDVHSHQAELLMDCLYHNKVPQRWSKVSYPSLRPLGSWFSDVLDRCSYLSHMKPESGQLPKVLNLSRIARIKAFAFALAQRASRISSWSLEFVQVSAELTNRSVSEIGGVSKEGMYVSGLWLHGARFNMATAMVEEGSRFENCFPLTVVHMKATPQEQLVSATGRLTTPQIRQRVIKGAELDETAQGNTFACPLYYTQGRFTDRLMTVPIPTMTETLRWSLCGVALYLDPYYP